MSTSGGSGGGGALVPVNFGGTLNVDGNVATQFSMFETQPSMPDANALAIQATSTPTVVAPLGNVCDSPTGFIVGIDTTTNAYVINVIITVSNLAATEVLQISGTVTVPVAGPNQSGSIDFTTADTTVIAGTDLTWDGTSIVSSTAGGVFVVSVALQSNYE